MNIENDRIFTLKQAISELNVTRKTLYDWKAKGIINFINITPGRRGIRQSEINRYLNEINK